MVRINLNSKYKSSRAANRYIQVTNCFEFPWQHAIPLFLHSKCPPLDNAVMHSMLSSGTGESPLCYDITSIRLTFILGVFKTYNIWLTKANILHVQFCLFSNIKQNFLCRSDTLSYINLYKTNYSCLNSCHTRLTFSIDATLLDQRGHDYIRHSQVMFVPSNHYTWQVVFRP